MVKSRDELDERYKWAIDEIYEEGEVEQEFESLEKDIQQIKSFKGKLNEEEKLAEFLKKYSEFKRRISKLSRYASMKSDQDTRDQEAQALKSRVSALSSKFSEETSFVNIEIQDIGEEELEQMIESNEEIREREYFLKEIIRLKPHTRSLEVEETISSLSEVLDAPSETFSMLSNADISFPEVERDGENLRITNSNFTKLLKDPERDFRQEVYEKYYGTLENYSNTFGTTLSKEVRSNVKMAEIRNYGSARESALKPNNIPTEVYDNLVETVEENLDALHRHMKIKADAREIDDIGMEDIYIPIAESEGPKIEYEEAREHIISALAPLGEEYVEKVREGLENRWVDVYETEGKRSGAYSGGSYDTRPFILMNYQNDIDSMFTLAHELGHSMHSHLTSENQPFLHSDYRIFVAEVASTVNEALLTKHLLESIEDQDFRKHILSHSLERFRSTVFRQTMFADFENQIHQLSESGEAVTPEAASDLYRDLKSNYYKPVKMDDHIENEWMRIPHFYYHFYVFQYATGMSAANRIVDIIERRGPEEYLEFLKKGGSAPPLELLKEVGVDMESSKPVESAISRYRKRMDQIQEEL